MHVTVPVTGRVLRIPVPDAVDPEQLRALIRITINGVAAKRARTHVFDDARYATAILTPRIRELEERGAA